MKKTWCQPIISRHVFWEYKDELFSFSDSHKEIKKMADAMSSAVKMWNVIDVNVLLEGFDDFSSPMSDINGAAVFLEHVLEIGFTFDCGNFIMHDEAVLLLFQSLIKGQGMYIVRTEERHQLLQ